MELGDDVFLKERSDITMNKTIYQSGSCGMLMPIETIEVSPGDQLHLKIGCETELARCTGPVRSSMVSDFYYVYVPYDQVQTNFNSYLFTSTGQGANHPYRTIDLNTNTNALTTTYHMLPYSASALSVAVNMLPFRGYQKIFYDMFSEPQFRHDASTSPSLYYSMGDGNDTTTSMALTGVPTDQKYFNKLLSNLSTSGSVSAPFTIRDLETAIVNERIYILKKKYGNKILDLISRIFKVKNLPSNSVIPLGVSKSALGNFTVLTTDSTSPSKPVSRFLGYTQNNTIDYTCQWYGMVFILGAVYPDDFAVQRGLNLLMDNEYKKDAYGYYRPEAQGLAYKTLRRLNLDVDGATPTDPIGSESLYDHMRESYSESKGAFSRSADLAPQVVNQTGVALSNYLYFAPSLFTALFAESPQVRFKMHIGGTINRQIKKHIEIADL